MLTDSEAVRRVVLGDQFAASRSVVFVPELRLNDCGGLCFDGAHKIDVAVLNLQTGVCHPIEAKLGFDRLSRNEFGKRFLGRCGTSHGNARVKGSMIAILERELPCACNGTQLTVTWQGSDYDVSTSWTLVARNRVTAKWKLDGAPRLSERCRFVEFESLVAAYGTPSEFNRLVEQTVSFDYYAAWRCKP